MSSEEFEYFFEPEELEPFLDTGSAKSDGLNPTESIVGQEPASRSEPEIPRTADSAVDKTPDAAKAGGRQADRAVAGVLDTVLGCPCRRSPGAGR